MTLAEAQAALGAPIAVRESTPGSGCFRGSSTAVGFAAVDGKVVALAAMGTVATASGLREGSSLADLKARVSGLTSRPYSSAFGETEYDLKAASGRAAAFLVDDSTQKIRIFLFGEPRYVIGVEALCE